MDKKKEILTDQEENFVTDEGKEITINRRTDTRPLYRIIRNLRTRIERLEELLGI